MAIVPILNIITLLKIIGKPWWWLFLFCIPGLNFVMHIITALEVAKVFGQGTGFAVGLIFLPVVFYPILAFSGATYMGPAQPCRCQGSRRPATGISQPSFFSSTTRVRAAHDSHSEPQESIAASLSASVRCAHTVITSGADLKTSWLSACGLVALMGLASACGGSPSAAPLKEAGASDERTPRVHDAEAPSRDAGKDATDAQAVHDARPEGSSGDGRWSRRRAAPLPGVSASSCRRS